jgi:flagellar protein FlbD
MITITKLNGQNLTVNNELIETMEETPDTTITMTTGHKLIAQESVDEIINKVQQYKRSLLT